MKYWVRILVGCYLCMMTHLLFGQPNNAINVNGSQPPPMSEFQQWLQSNGYGQTPENPPPNNAPPDITTGISTPPPKLPSPPAHIKRETIVRLRQGPPLSYEQSKKIMLESAPPAPPPTEEESTAFNTLLQQNMPLKPQQVVQLRQQIDVAQRAAVIPPVVPPKPVSSTIMINLAPGTTPPVIRLALGYVSSLVFVDSTGSPWPIASFDIGNPKNVNIQWDGKSNILLMQAVAPYGSGDIVFRLVGLPTPITLELISGQRVVDYRVDLHVPGIGPNAKDIPIGISLPESASSLLLGVLDGVAPVGSKLLAVIGSADSLAWLLGEKMYLRTRYTVLSPGWTATMVSIDGMHAYELPRTSSILISKYGEPYELKVEGF